MYYRIASTKGQGGVVRIFQLSFEEPEPEEISQWHEEQNPFALIGKASFLPKNHSARHTCWLGLRIAGGVQPEIVLFDHEPVDKTGWRLLGPRDKAKREFVALLLPKIVPA